jgi:hypothetical protein
MGARRTLRKAAGKREVDMTWNQAIKQKKAVNMRQPDVRCRIPRVVF